MPSQPLILDCIYSVLQHAQNVETRQDRVCELHILRESLSGIIPAPDWVGSSNDSASRLQCGDDTCFGDRNALLFHGFVNAGSVGISHLVELID